MYLINIATLIIYLQRYDSNTVIEKLRSNRQSIYSDPSKTSYKMNIQFQLLYVYGHLFVMSTKQFQVTLS